MLFPIANVIVQNRKRKDYGDIEGLADSIRRNGLFNPIIIDEDNVLHAGERRLRACALLGWDTIEVRRFEALTDFQKMEIELEENTRRKDFTWQEECFAYEAYHEHWHQHEEGWTFEKTAEKLNVSISLIRKRILVARALRENPALVADCPTYTAAINVVERALTRLVDREIADIIDADIPSAVTEIVDPRASYEAAPAGNATVACEDFHEWAASYSGPRFHFLHLDPPYGIEHQDSKQGSATSFETYEDSPETYFRFLRTLLNHQDRLFSSKAHIMIWFAMKHYEQTLAMLRHNLGDSRVQTSPLIWHKSDATGIVPDVTREPRRVYETALILSVGDRRIVRVVNNLYAHPVNKQDARHLSEKPEAMLRYFFQMFIDQQTRVLDPCCGAGSSLAAAVSLNAEAIFGIDISPSNVELSEIAIKKAQHNALSTVGPEGEP